MKRLVLYIYTMFVALTAMASLYIPKSAEGKLPAIAVSGPFGAVKEQCSGLYAQTMAERGFITIALTLRLQANPQENLAVRLLPTSIRKTFWLL